MHPLVGFPCVLINFADRLINHTLHSDTRELLVGITVDHYHPRRLSIHPSIYVLGSRCVGNIAEEWGFVSFDDTRCHDVTIITTTCYVHG